jgi:hypothetical protein
MTTHDLIDQLSAELTPADPWRIERRVAAAAAGGLALALGVILATLGARPDLPDTLATGAGLLKFAGGAMAAMLALRLGCRLSRPGLRPVLCPTTLALALGVAALGIGAVLLADRAPPLGAILRSAPGCTSSIVALSVVPLAAALAALRAGAPERPALAGAAAGLASGALGALAYALWCPADHPAFVAVAYGAALAASAAIGAVAGRLALRW